MSIEERIQVTGADQAARDVKRVADATGDVGQKTEDAGQNAENAERGFGGLSGQLGDLGSSISSMFAGFASLEAIIAGLREFNAILQRTVELRNELAEGAVGTYEAVFPLAEQRGDVSQSGQDQTLADATRLRKAAAMSDLSSASALGVASDINLPGGFDPAEDKEAFERNMVTASAVGGAIPLGDQDTYGGIFALLKSAGITDPEQIKVELARVLAIQKASDSASLASFVTGMADTGIKSFLAGGGSLTDAALILLQARKATSNDAQASTAAGILLQAARGSTATTKFLAGKAGDFGMGDFDAFTDTEKIRLLERIFAEAEAGGPRAMTALQREGFEPAQFPQLKTAFGTIAREAAGAARALAAGATAEDINRKVRDFQESLIGRSRRTEAGIEEKNARVGREHFDVYDLRRQAAQRVDEERAGRSGFGGWLDAAVELVLSDRGQQDITAIAILRDTLRQYVDEHPDLSPEQLAAVKAADDAVRRTQHTTGLWFGADEERLRETTRLIVNITNIGTQYAGPDPEANSPEYPDLGD